MTIRGSVSFALLVVLTGAGTVRAQAPVGTAFTYQGRLSDGGAPPTGAYDLQFRLFDAATAGTQVGGTITLPSVAVTGGLFTVKLDFGASAFTGGARWLEVGVRPGGSPNPFTILSPRQELTPTPDAIFSSTAPWSGVTGKPAGFADDVDNDSGGDITGVSAGTGLLGGGSSGNVTLGVNTGVIQARVTGICDLGSSIRVVNDDGSVVCQADTTGNDWSRSGNAGTNPATDFLGTTDNQAFELRVNDLRTLRIEPRATAGVYQGPNVILGHEGNSVASGVNGAVVGGGGGVVLATASPNSVTGHFGTVSGGGRNTAGQLATVGGGEGNTALGGNAVIGGGTRNVASGLWAAVGGGNDNNASGQDATIGGGAFNAISGNWATAVGGRFNSATGRDATVGGGAFNTASGLDSTAPGGISNVAGGDFSFAAGRQAKVRDATGSADADGDEGTFVWADAQGVDFQSTGPNQFLVRAAGGVGINLNNPSTSLDVAGGIRGSASAGNGVQGLSTDVGASGVYGETTAGYGVAGRATAGGIAIFGDAVGGLAGLFNGDVQVIGNLSKGGGSFRIDHPLDPRNKSLSHSFVESPDMMNIYNGNVTTGADGFATVELPEWFEALNRDFRYQLTVIGSGAWARARVAREIQHNRFVVETDIPGTRVSWQVTGIRQDAWAEKHRIRVEEEKPHAERGRLLHPEAFGAEEVRSSSR